MHSSTDAVYMRLVSYRCPEVLAGNLHAFSLRQLVKVVFRVLFNLFCLLQREGVILDANLL